MKKNLKKMASYYKPYFGTFMLDLFFAFLASATALVIPLVVRYITSNIANIKAATRRAIGVKNSSVLFRR